MAAAATTSNAAAAASTEPVYRHYRKDFGPLQTRPLHLDLDFDVYEDKVRVVTRTTFVHVAKDALTQLQLNSNDLQIESVELLQGASELSVSQPSSDEFVTHVTSLNSSAIKATPLKFDLDSKGHFLNITLSEPVQQGSQFVLRTVSVATPTAHILEGLYYDWTPDGQPRTIITQCQQHGFQRIVPALDTMTAKAYYTTRITADAKYSHLITNGDLAPGFFDAATGEPRPHSAADGKDGQKRCSVTYYNHKVNMAPYLFFLGAGHYVSYRGEVEYPNGATFLAELLVFPGLVEEAHAKSALQSLIDSIQWCYCSTGPEATEHTQERKRIYELLAERDALKKKNSLSEAENAKLAELRAELKRLDSVWNKTGYAYTGAIYREISMQNSDYGGMENVGNTTILASRMVPSANLSDPAYLYLEGVKIHEFYHSINGSQVTGESPFEIWLNEAVTVHIQRQREGVLFGSDFMRLKEVAYAFTPGQGPLAIDSGANAMPIEPKGFNRTQELISAMTYSKAPEFVHMIELLIGTPTFNRGLDLYHTKFAFSNASTDDWVHSMEEASGQQLMPMANRWLRRSGHPHVEYSGAWDESKKEYTLRMKQSNLPTKGDTAPWIFPVRWALIKDGKAVHEGMYTLSEESASLVIPGVAVAPDFVSFACGWSFFGTHANTSASDAQLAQQALADPDVINRYFSYRAVTDKSKAKIIEALRADRAAATAGSAAEAGKGAEYPPAGAAGVVVADEWVELHARLLFDESLSAGARAAVLREGEDITTRPDLAHLYWEIADAKLALLQAVYDRHADKIVALYNEIQARNRAGPHLEQLHDRALKHHLFNLIAAGNKPRSVLASRKPSAVTADVSAMARALLTSPFMSDRLFGFSAFLSGPASLAEKQSVRSQMRSAWKSHPDTVEVFVSVIGSVDDASAPDLIRELVEDKEVFDVAQAGHARTLTRLWAGNRKRSLLSEEGRKLTLQLFLQVGKVNQYSAQSFIAALNDLAKFDAQTTQKDVLQLVRDMHAGLDPVKTESLFNQLTATLAPYKDA